MKKVFYLLVGLLFIAGVATISAAGLPEEDSKASVEKEVVINHCHYIKFYQYGSVVQVLHKGNCPNHARGGAIRY